jgi:hypothetical protein
MSTTQTPDTARKVLNGTGAVVAVLVVLILGVSIGALVHFDIPKDNHDILLVLVTAVATNVTAIVAYFFGSSIGTARQGEIIGTMAATAAAAQDKLPSIPGAPDKTIPLKPDESVVVKADPKP